MSRTINPSGKGRYSIRVRGKLGEEWSDWFGGMTFTYKQDVTTIQGSVKDQTALHGILNRIRDLGIPLLSLNRVDTSEDEAPPSHHEEEE